MEENQSNTSKNNGSNSKKWILIIVAVIVILAIAGGGGFLFLRNNEGSSLEESIEPTEEGQVQISPAPTSQPESMNPATYKDGTYSAEGKYTVHSGEEQIGVKITIKNGIVTDVVVIQEAKLPMSKTMQADFAANFKPMVIGKNIDTLVLGKVSGSSLTPLGFNDALDQIKAQAKS
jgi:flagellar basal body-associated protein FliL